MKVTLTGSCALAEELAAALVDICRQLAEQGLPCVTVTAEPAPVPIVAEVFPRTNKKRGKQ